MRRQDIVRIVLAVTATIAALAFVWVQVIAPRDAALAETIGRGDYRLAATDGTEFTQATLKGAPSAIFFGFTHCPEVCPTTLGDIATWTGELGADADDLRVYFVTVDPERDTAELLGEYVGWVPGVTGVTGTSDEIKKAILAFKVYAAKVPLKDGGYTMDHSAMILLFDEDGRFTVPIRYQEDFDSAIGKLRKLLDS